MLNDYTLTFTSTTGLSFCNYGTFDIGDQTLTFASAGGANFANYLQGSEYGIVNGTGAFRTTGLVSLAAGTFNPPLTVASGTTTASGSLNGSLTVASGATLQIPAQRPLVYGEITVNGALSGGGGNASLYSYGSAFTNNGAVSPTYVYFYGSTFANNGTVSVTGVSFNGSGTQTIQGTGPSTLASYGSDQPCR